MSFRHAKCGGRHDSVAEARTCEAGGNYSTLTTQQTQTQSQSYNPLLPEFVGKSQVVHRGTSPSDSQLDYLRKLKADPSIISWARQSQRGFVGDMIEQIKSMKGHQQGGRRVSDKTDIPLSLLKNMPDGYYAARPDSTVPYTFFRVSRPVKGQYKGVIKVQTQHGDNLKMMLTLDPTEDFLKFIDRRTEDVLLYAAIDPRGCQLEYGQALNHCCKCGKSLTDDRSRFFGIGPDCEQDHPDYIEEVVDMRGPYPGPGWQ